MDCFVAALLAMTVVAAPQLPPARADAAIHRVNNAGGIAGAVGGEERHQGADFAGMRGATERKTLLKLLVAAFVAELVFCAGLQHRAVAVGADRLGIDSDPANVVAEALELSATR